MKKRIGSAFLAATLALPLLSCPSSARAQESSEGVGGIHVLGSVLFSILHVPMKLVSCVGTQATAAVAYTATYGVPGHYDGETNGRDIGETARRSCTGDWIVRPSQVKADYGR